jgi:hypothetical protein
MDKPDPVSLVMPPTTTMPHIRRLPVSSHIIILFSGFIKKDGAKLVKKVCPLP